MKLEKDGIVKEILNKPEIDDYITAGWKPFAEKEKEEIKIEIKSAFKRMREDK